MQGSPRIDELRQKFHENPRRYFAPLANEYRKAGDPEQAIAICRAHLAQQPGHMSGHVVYAQSLYDAGRVDESRVVFEKALSLDPDNAVVLRYLGDICRQRGDSKEALHWYTRALDADPQDTEVAAYVAELTEPLTETAQEPAEPIVAESAVVAGEEGEEEVPPAGPQAGAESPFVTRTMAELYAKQGHRDAALDVYRKLAAANPADTEIADRIRELSDVGDEAEAAAEAESAPTPEAVTPATAPDTTEPAVAEPVEAKAEISEPVAEASEPAAIPQMEPVEFVDLAPIAESAEAVESTSNEFAEPADSNGGFDFPAEAEAPVTEETTASTDTPAEKHFTEMEIGAGDEWDTDQWGAGFSSEEMVVERYDFTPSEGVEDEPSGEAGDEARVAASEEEPVAEGDTQAEAAAAPAEPELVESVSSGPEQPATAEEVPAEAYAERSDETPAETTVEVPSESPSEPPVELAAEAPAEPAPETPAETSAEAEAPAQTQEETQEEARAEAPEETPAEVPAEAAAEAVAELPAEPAAVEPVLSDPEATVEAEQEAWRPAETAAESHPFENAYADDSEPAPVPLGILNDARHDASADEMFDFPEREDDEHLVAYAPHTPDDAELPHFEPKGPTIREFFATLGARKMSSPSEDQSFTARAVVPGVDPVESHLPAPDAFSNLFADEPVAEEDSRAAFALSGALSGRSETLAPSVARSTPASPVARVDEPAAAAEASPAAQETEDDIRKFREWLDGLADS